VPINQLNNASTHCSGARVQLNLALKNAAGTPVTLPRGRDHEGAPVRCCFKKTIMFLKNNALNMERQV
jgi:hypothetical protein